MSGHGKGSQLTDPKYCIEEAKRLLIPVTEENWRLAKEDADALNVLQAAITHLVYLDTEREEFQEQVLNIVWTAYLLGRTAEERLRAPEAFRDLIESLDFSGFRR